MKAKLLFLLAGGLLGGFVGAFIVGRSHPVQPTPPVLEERTDVSAHSNEVYQLGHQLAQAQTRIKQAEEDNRKLNLRLRELGDQMAGSSETNASKPKNFLATIFGGGEEGATNQQATAMQEMMRAAMEQQMEAKISSMKSRLKLTPDQEAAARKILEKQFGLMGENAAKMMKGELSKDDMADVAKAAGNPEKELKDLLTPQQQSDYDQLQLEERQNQARLVANSELLQMQSTLGLTQEQQDKVFAVLFEQTHKQLSGDAVAGSDATGLGSLEAMNKAKLDALKGILTDDQLASYQKFQDTQMKMIQSFMPKDGKSGDAVMPINGVQAIPAPGKP